MTFDSHMLWYCFNNNALHWPNCCRPVWLSGAFTVQATFVRSSYCTSCGCAQKVTGKQLNKSTCFEEQTSVISCSCHHLMCSRGVVFHEDCWAAGYVQTYLLYATSNKSAVPWTVLKGVLARFFCFALLFDHLRSFSLLGSWFQVCCLICYLIV